MLNTNKEKLTEEIISSKIIGIVRDKNAKSLMIRAKAIVDGGVTVMEVPLNSENPYDAIRQLAADYQTKAYVGAGTVLCAEHCIKAIECGANFIVSPIYVEEVHKVCLDKDVLYIPGAMTPTEIFAIKKRGIQLIKLFPANVLGAFYVRSILAPFEDLSLIAFGGIDLGNMGEWFKSGVKAVAIGNALVRPSSTRLDEEEIRKNAKIFVDLAREALL